MKAADQVPDASLVENTASGIVSFLKTLRKYWPILVACVSVAVGGALVYTRMQRPIFQASALVEFDPDVVQPLGNKDDESAMSYWDNHEYYETQYKIIASNRVLVRAVRDLGLMGKTTGAHPTSEDDLAASLRTRLTVEPIKNSRLVLVKFDDPDPKNARRVCDAIVQAYITQNLDKKVQATGDAVVWLNGQVDQYRSSLDSDENALHDFKVKNDLPSTSINEASNMVRLEMQTFDEALNKTKTKKEELLARNSELASVSADNPDDIAESELLSSPFLQTLRTQYQAALRDRTALIASGKGEKHPEVKAMTERLDEARAALLNEVRNIQKAVARDLAAVEKQETGDARLYEDARKKAVDLNMKEIEYHRLDRAREQDEKVYALLLERMKQADLERMMHVNNVRQIDAPTEPNAPIRPRPATNVMVGLVLGLFAGLALAWLREQLDNSVKTPDDVEQVLNVTFLGLLPSVEEEEERERSRRSRRAPAQHPPELIVHERPLSGVAEAARAIRTNLLFANPDHPYRRLLVSSAAPSEGKTTVASSIAVALAQGGQRVCIVDCDLRRPRLHRIFNRVGDMGVTNVLVGDATIPEVAKPTIVDNLWSIPSGPIPPNPADVLHSNRFKKFIDDLSEHFDRVIIDSPPLVPVTDAAILSTLVDGTVFVIRAFKTTKPLAKQGLRALLDVDAKLVGTVLNAVNLNSHEYNYYHYYYYKRDGYRASPTSPKEDELAPPAAPH